MNSFNFYILEYVAKIDEWKNQFDIILFDTPPLLSVSDTSILMTYSDINITVVRHGLSKINELKQLGSIAKQIGINIDIIAYNAYKTFKLLRLLWALWELCISVLCEEIFRLLL